MSDSNQETIGSPEPEPNAGLNRDPEDWVTGDEPMTAAHRSSNTLTTAAGQDGAERAYAESRLKGGLTRPGTRG